MGQYRLCIATQPVYQETVSNINDPDAVFDFFDGFEGTALDLTKWTLGAGIHCPDIVAGRNADNERNGNIYTFTRLHTVGPGYAAETRARHPSAGVFRLIAEFGFSDASWNAVRIADYYIDNPYWQRQSKLNGGADTWINMAQTADPGLASVQGISVIMQAQPDSG